jgi:hypothetical protein
MDLPNKSGHGKGQKQKGDGQNKRLPSRARNKRFDLPLTGSAALNDSSSIVSVFPLPPGSLP